MTETGVISVIHHLSTDLLQSADSPWSRFPPDPATASVVFRYIPETRVDVRAGKPVIMWRLAPRAAMKRLLLIPLVLLSTIQAAGVAQSQQRSTAKSASRKRSPARKKTVPAVDPTVGDSVDGDDLTVRRAAVSALGGFAGSVVVADPTSGRILSMVNQKLALQTGFVPCSTVKLVTSLAALTENVVTKNTSVYISRYVSYNMTQALARSNNQYFNILGRRLGFDRVHHYAQMLGFGEKAGLDIAGEQAGVLPEAEPPAGVGMMTSFGTGILMTPLERPALLGALVNNTTLFTLQDP